MNTHWSRTAFCSLALAANAMAEPERPSVPKPYVVAPACTAEQLAAAVTAASIQEPVLACFYLHKWSFRGAALAVAPESHAGKSVSSGEFRELRRSIFRDQSVRLRAEANLADSLPGQPPSHASIPSSLFVEAPRPLGVFLDEPNHIGFADLMPVSKTRSSGVTSTYPFIRLETWVLAQGKVFKLIQMSPISGASTIGEGYRMADDWARRFNGSERLATED